MEHIYSMTNAAKKAGRLLVRDFMEIERGQVSPKSKATFVLRAEERSEQILIDGLTKDFPGFNILSEGKGFVLIDQASEYTWIIDPLDGTNNFGHGFPFFAISIALKRKNEIIAGLVYDPLQDHLYTSSKGNGSFRNNTRIRATACRNLRETMMASSPQNKYFKLMAESVYSMRTMGCVSLTLAYLAAGRIDAYVESDRNVWDLAAGSLLVAEAGGTIDDLEKKGHYLQTGSFLAAPPGLFRAFRGLFGQE